MNDITLTKPIKNSDVKCDPIILRFNQMLSDAENSELSDEAA
jgi:hypothetical protein